MKEATENVIKQVTIIFILTPLISSGKFLLNYRSALFFFIEDHIASVINQENMMIYSFFFSFLFSFFHNHLTLFLMSNKLINLSKSSNFMLVFSSAFFRFQKTSLAVLFSYF